MSTNNHKRKELKELTEDSKEILNRFLGIYRSNKDSRSSNTYHTSINQLRELTGITDFRKLTYNDYCLTVNKNLTSNKGGINTFFQYLYCKNLLLDESGFINCFWNKEKINADFETKKHQKIRRANKNYVPSLSIEDIENLISFTNKVSEDDFRNSRLAFCFYIIYYEGISREDILTLDANDFNQGKIMITGSSHQIPEKYWKLFEYLKGRDGSKFTTLNRYIDILGNELGIKRLTPQIIKKARDQNLFKCPQCGVPILAFSENWHSINGKLMCRGCAQKLLNGNKLKKNFIVNDIQDTLIEVVSEVEKDNIQHIVTSFETLQAKLQFPTNFEKLNKFLDEIGKLGEKYVYEQEVIKLKNCNSKYYQFVEQSPADDHKNGFDIVSYTPSGEKIYIEVKTTTGDRDQPFYISANERNKAEEVIKQGGHYQIHRVFFVKDKNKISRVIYEKVDKTIFNFEEVVYKVTLK